MTAKNIQYLLEWKNANPLSKKKQVQAQKLKDNKSFLNRFRKLPEISTDELEKFWVLVSSIIKTGIVWRVFILHITRPTDYPIVDQHVLRAWNYLITGSVKEPEKNWDNYEKYRIFFLDIARQSGNDFRTVDRALMAFGQFLRSQFFKK